MKDVIVKEIRHGLRLFQALIHPDKFSLHPQVCRVNAEAFKTVVPLTEVFLGRLERCHSDRLFLRMNMMSVTFFTDHENPVLKHVLPFSGDPAMEDESFVSWQESALSLFHLFIKAHLEPDQRIIQWLIHFTNNSNIGVGDGNPFEYLMSKETSESSQSMSFDLKQAAACLSELTNVQIISTLDPESKRTALLSIWRSHQALLKLKQSHPHLRFIISNLALKSSPNLIVLPPQFQPLEISNR